jgi:hypothetical protein
MDLSLFGQERVAALANAEVLIRDFVEQPDLGKDDFLTKVGGQLSASPPGAVRLAAELLYVHLLMARSSTVSGQRKIELVRATLGFADGEHDLALAEYLIRAGHVMLPHRLRPPTGQAASTAG